MIRHLRQSLKSNAGIGQLALLILVLLFTCVFYAAYHIVPFFYYYYEIKGEMDSQARKAQLNNDEKLRKYLLKKIHNLQLPIESEDDLHINRSAGKLIIELKYEEVFYVDFGGEYVYDLYVFKFNPRVERRL